MNIVSAEQDRLEMMIKQMGAKVQSIHGILCYVKFYINDFEISYCYNINAKNEFFLQRVKPYPIGAGVFPNQKEIVKYIKEDIRQFKNAYQSRVFDKFIEVNSKFHETIHDIEELFLQYNVPLEDMENIEKALKDIQEKISVIRDSSPHITLE